MSAATADLAERRRSRLPVAALAVLAGLLASLPVGATGALAAPVDACAAAEPVAGATVTVAQCENWYRPVLCRVEFRGAREDGQWGQIDPDRTIELAPGGRMRLEILGQDQDGRSFPEYRMGFGHDARSCSGVIEFVEVGNAEFEARARSSSGRCAVELWVPGNMNLEWRLDFEIRPGARAAYARAEAELVVDRLYGALLDREPDPGSRGQAVTEIQSGNLESQVATMVRSPEFRRKMQGKDAGAMLEQIYRGLLGRAPDSGAVRVYLPRIQRGEVIDAVVEIVRSPEFEDVLAGRSR